MDRTLFKELSKLVKGNVLCEVPLSRHTSLKVGGHADIMIYPAHMEELLNIIRFSRRQAIPYFVMGAGTNLVVRDGGIRGMVIKLTRCFRKITLIRSCGDELSLQAEAGVSLRRLLAFCLGKELAGLEFVSGIPGTLGGAWAMNAGAQGKEMGPITEALTLLTREGAVEEKKSAEMHFSYRRLHLPPGSIIVKGLLHVTRGTRSALKGAVEKINRWRWRAQPLHLPSAGSVFKNPPGHSAGQLLERAGLKGRLSGGAQVSEKHANFIVNAGGATAQDILTLMGIMQSRVYEETGIELEPEVEVVGEDG